MSITVVGSVGLDTITTPHGKVEETIGGSASHFSVVASYFAPVRLVGIVGEDFPATHRDMLHKRGVDLAGLKTVPGATFRWSGYYTVDFHQAHTLETHLNVFQHFKPDLPESYRKSPFLFLANIDPTLQLEVLEQVDNPRLIMGDTMNYWIEHNRDGLLKVIPKLNVFILSDGEAKEICETANLIKAGRQLLKMGPKYIIIKKGEHGALLFHENRIFSVPAYSYVDVVDPTGAGDSFAGGFMGYIARTGDISEAGVRRAVVFGCVMGSFNVEGFSMEKTRDLDMSTILERYEGLRQITVF